MGGGGHKTPPRRKKKKASFPSLVDLERAAQKEVAARVAARKAAAAKCREANIKRRLLQPDEVRAPSPVVAALPMVTEQVVKQTAEEERQQRQQRLSKVRAEMMAKSRSAAAALRSSGKVEGTGARSLWSREAGVPTRSTAFSPEEARANDPEYQGWLKQHGVPQSVRVFSLAGSVSGGKNKVLRQYLLDAGLYENTDADSPNWDFKWILRRADVDWRAIRPWQAINSFEPTVDISTTHFVTKKLGLGKALASSHWVGVNAAAFFPQQFDCNDAGERVEFLRAFLYCAAQGVLRRWVDGAAGGGGLGRMAAVCMAQHTEQELRQLQEATRVCRIVLHERRWLVDAHGGEDGDSDITGEGRADWTSINWAIVLGDRDAAAAENCLAQSATEADAPGANQLRLFTGANDTLAKDKRMSRADQAAASTSAFKQAMAARTAARAFHLDAQKQKRERKRAAREERFGMVSEPEPEPEPEPVLEDGMHIASSESESESEPEPADPVEVSEAERHARSVIASLSVCDPQWRILGQANAWVAKPASQSRGRGITVSGSLAKLLKTMGHGLQSDGKKAPKLEQMSMVERMNSTTSTDWIVQKYVESPSLIDGKKWDLRMWACVTCWNPLTVWWYLDGYLRFAVRDFSLEGSALEDAIAHVTNIEFQRESDDLKEIGVDWAQWHTDEYIAWLKKNFHSDRKWTQEIQPAMQRVAVSALACAGAGRSCTSVRFYAGTCVAC